MWLLPIALVAACLIALAVWLILCRPFLRGNLGPYSLSQLSPRSDSPLRGKRIFFLGSSVTQGMRSRGLSFVDYLAREDGCLAIKAAAMASTLADRGPNSYLKRLRRHSATAQPIDCFVCQLSTNDATFHSPLGEISPGFDPAGFDTRTAAGGIEAIIHFARQTWNCPIVFVTGTRYDNPRYHKLVNLLLDAGEKWNIHVIDLWHRRAMNQITPELRALYMADGVHPTRAGYLLWWTPAIREELCRILADTPPSR